MVLMYIAISAAVVLLALANGGLDMTDRADVSRWR